MESATLWSQPKCIEVEVFLWPFPPVLMVFGREASQGTRVSGAVKGNSRCQLCIPLLASPTLTPSSSPGFSPKSLENDCWFSLGTSAKFLSQFAQLPSKIIHRIFKFLTRSIYCLRRDYSHTGILGESGPAKANRS